MHIDHSLSSISNTPTIPIGTDEMRKRMGEILDCVNLRGDEFIIERKNKPLAILMPIQKHKALTEMARRLSLELMNQRNNALSQDEADALADEAKHKSREDI